MESKITRFFFFGVFPPGNGNSRILKWRYVSTIFLAIFWVPIDWRYLPYIRPIFQGIPIDNTFQYIFLGNEHPQLPAFFLMFTGVANAVRHLSPDFKRLGAAVHRSSP